MASFFACLFVIVIGIFSLSLATNHWKVWTSESARRLAVSKRPLKLPDVDLINTQGKSIRLHSKESTLTIMEFIFTACPTVCQIMGDKFRELQNHLFTEGIHHQVRLLSLTFSPEDKEIELRHYLEKYAANTHVWNAAYFKHPKELNRFMDLIGVIAIPEPEVGFIHNAAVYFIKNNQLIAIYDYDDVELKKHINNHLQPNSLHSSISYVE